MSFNLFDLCKRLDEQNLIIAKILNSSVELSLVLADLFLPLFCHVAQRFGPEGFILSSLFCVEFFGGFDDFGAFSRFGRITCKRL